MTSRREGITRTYGRVHNPNEQAEEIQRLRELRIELDRAVANAYGWSDLQLDHGFRQTARGVRFTISEAARCEILDRLLSLNHRRHESEVASGLHDGKKGKPWLLGADAQRREHQVVWQARRSDRPRCHGE